MGFPKFSRVFGWIFLGFLGFSGRFFIEFCEKAGFGSWDFL